MSDTTPVVMDDYMAGYRQAQSDAAGLREAAQAILDKYGPHSGLCCTFDGDGSVVVTDKSCKCEPVRRALRAALAMEEQP